jgi:cytochrome P450
MYVQCWFTCMIITNLSVACWVLLRLAENPYWKEKVKAEVDSLIALHTNTTSTEPLHKRLSAIPVTAWEDEMPVLDAVQRETLRLIQSGTVLRRNVIEDLKVDGKIIEKGAFLGYSLADVHHNPDIYHDPLRFDPDRFGVGRAEDRKGTMSFLGWGAGECPRTLINGCTHKDPRTSPLHGHESSQARDQIGCGSLPRRLRI